MSRNPSPSFTATVNPAVLLLEDALRAAESGNSAAFDAAVDALCSTRSQSMVHNLARLTRSVHESLHHIDMGDRLAEMSGQHLPDAQLRLEHVVKLTEDAAHQTLDQTERAQGAVRELGAGLPEALRARHAAQLQAIEASLSEISVAQAYQDLAGQTIRKVAALVTDVEAQLVQLLRSSGLAPKKPQQASATETLAGPAVPGLDTDHANGQDDVDQLLASLGV